MAYFDLAQTDHGALRHEQDRSGHLRPQCLVKTAPPRYTAPPSFSPKAENEISQDGTAKNVNNGMSDPQNLARIHGPTAQGVDQDGATKDSDALQPDFQTPGKRVVAAQRSSSKEGAARLSATSRPTSAVSTARGGRPSSASMTPRNGRRGSAAPVSYRMYTSRVEDSQWSVRDNWHERTYIVAPEKFRQSARKKEAEPKQHLIFRPLCTKPKPAWTERFHIVSSKENNLCNHRQRKYFDHLPTSTLESTPKARPTSAARSTQTSRPQSAVASSVGRKSYAKANTIDSEFGDGDGSQEGEEEVDPDGNAEPPRKDLERTFFRRNARKTRQAVLEQKVCKLYSLANDMPRLKPYADFYLWCIKNFQNLTRCWRRLDTSCNMSLSQLEFLMALRDYNFKGDAKMIFQCLDRDRSGSLSYYHFDPTGAKNLIKLIVWAEDKFGTMEKFFQVMDKDRNRKLTAEEFKEGMKKHGFESPEPLGHLFQLLDLDKDQYITVVELGFLINWRFDPWMKVDPDDEAAREFKNRLMVKYRDNSLIAWNLGLDLNNAMRVSWDEFQTAGGKQGIDTLKLARIWRSFDQNQGGWLSFKEFDAEGYRLLAQFKESCIFKFGSIRDALKIGDLNEDRIITKKEFRAILREVGFKNDDLEDGQGSWLFYALDYNGQGVITPEKVRYLDTWSLERDAQDEEFWKVISTCFETTKPESRPSQAQLRPASPTDSPSEPAIKPPS
eukprot:gnl/MRDRNA2_/MRDRNA2_100525_c0_seq1.p1 gnl/MRDRNA2_/MRDRNA2_100525_c0~~gnl/MRDRNA2_/MRDRNA2_100525_c0_seq1.p1  ORF type:complete len:726 (+),score=122.91 gnl/MRDRNA2_/MRDRNA2_100525_c0_seq1:241-2418(+)